MKKTTKLKAWITTLTVAGTTFISNTVAFAEGDGGKILPGAEGLKNELLGLIGTAFILFLAWSAFKNFVAQAYGKMAMLIGGGLLVGWIIYFPDNFIGFLKRILEFFTQGG